MHVRLPGRCGRECLGIRRKVKSAKSFLWSFAHYWWGKGAAIINYLIFINHACKTTWKKQLTFTASFQVNAPASRCVIDIKSWIMCISLYQKDARTTQKKQPDSFGEIFNHSHAEATFHQITRMQNFREPSKPCHVCIHWIALAEYSRMSNHMPGFQSFFSFLHHFVLAK